MSSAMVIRRLMLWAFDRLYNEAAWAYDLAAAVAGGEFWYRWGRAVLPFVRDEPVLEVGIGRARLLTALAAEGHQVVGIDLSPAMLRYARREILAHGLSVPLVRASGTALPFADATFGTLITTFPAPYIRERVTHREFARVLRPGGHWLWADAPRGTGPATIRGGLTTLLSRPSDLADRRVEELLGNDPSGAFEVKLERVPVGPTEITVRVATRRRAEKSVK